MAIPDMQSLLLPLLELAGDNDTHQIREAVGQLADRLQLTDSERRERIPSGLATRFYLRVSHARRHLKKAGLLEDPRRGQFRITELGQRVLEIKLSLIDLEFVREIKESPDPEKFLRELKESPGAGAGEGQPSPKEKSPLSTVTPEEALQDAYETLRNSLSADLLEQVMKASPEFFELLVVDVLVSMGYGGSRKDAGEAIGRSGDEGIDGIIKEDRLGLDIIYIQAKRWASKVGRPEVQRFAGALQGKRARKGVFITTSSFTREAEEYADRIETRVILIDGKRLAAFMIDHGVGVRTDATYEVKRIDADVLP